MESLALFFSRSGHIARKPFVLAVLLVYALMFASQILLSQPVMARSGAAPFALVQAALIYVWYVLHAKRLRDAGHGAGSALAIAILYGLGVVLFMLLAQFVGAASGGGTGTETGTDAGGGLGGLLILLFLFALLSGDAHTLGVFFHVILGILFVIFLPLLIALGFSIWTGTRRPVPAASAPAAAP